MRRRSSTWEPDLVVLDGKRTLEDRARIGRLQVTPRGVASLPARFHCREMTLTGSGLQAFRSGWTVSDRLELIDCTALTSLPEALQVPVLTLRGCRALTELPRMLRTHFLDLTGCEWLESLPDDLSVTIGRLIVRDCTRLRSIPASVGPIAQLDVSGCPLLERLPENLDVRSVIDIGGSGLTSLPEGCRRSRLLWRSVPIDERIAFRPHEISGREIVDEENTERRRVMLERVGFERFIDEVGAEVLDSDTDPGGARRLLRAKMEDDEDLVCVSVNCPTTGRHYLLRVPPTMRTCRQAVAWTAGYDDPDDYVPEIET